MTPPSWETLEEWRKAAEAEPFGWSDHYLELDAAYRALAEKAEAVLEKSKRTDYFMKVGLPEFNALRALLPPGKP